MVISYQGGRYHNNRHQTTRWPGSYTSYLTTSVFVSWVVPIQATRLSTSHKRIFKRYVPRRKIQPCHGFHSQKITDSCHQAQVLTSTAPRKLGPLIWDKLCYSQIFQVPTPNTSPILDSPQHNNPMQQDRRQEIIHTCFNFNVSDETSTSFNCALDYLKRGKMVNPLTHWDIKVTGWGGKIRVSRPVAAPCKPQNSLDRAIS